MTNIVKVRILSNSGETKQEYTYFSMDPLKVGDIVKIPVKDSIGTGKVTAINVPDDAIASFRDKVKTIPANSGINNLKPPEGEVKIPEPEKPITSRGMVDDFVDHANNYSPVFAGQVIPCEDIESGYPQELITQKEARDILIKNIGNLTVEDQPQFERAGGLIIKLRDFTKFMEGVKKKILDREVKPILDQVKIKTARINLDYDAFMNPIFLSEFKLSQNTKQYQLDQASLAREAQRKADKQAKERFEKQKAAEAVAKKAADEARVKKEATRKAEEEARLAAEQAKTKTAQAAAQKAVEEARLQAEAASEEARRAEEEAAKKVPDLPVQVAEIVEGPTKSLKTDSGTYTSKFFWRAKPATNADNVPATTKIPRRFDKIDWPQIQAFVKNGKNFTFGTEVAPNEFLVKECPGIVIYQEVQDQARGSKRKEFENG